MCEITIVDTNSLKVLVSKKGTGDELLLRWIRNRHGVLAFSNVGGYYEEIRPNRAVMELIRRYDQGGQLRKVSEESLETAARQVDQICYRSDDPHVLALALASDARVLCSKDCDLRKDFKDTNILPTPGNRRRVLYPMGGDHNRRRRFLSRHRCTSRSP